MTTSTEKTPDITNHIDNIGNPSKTERSVDEIGNVPRNSQHNDHGPDSRNDPDFGGNNGYRSNSNLF